jgi:hypothetical protein
MKIRPRANPPNTPLGERTTARAAIPAAALATPFLFGRPSWRPEAAPFQLFPQQQKPARGGTLSTVPPMAPSQAEAKPSRGIHGPHPARGMAALLFRS